MHSIEALFFFYLGLKKRVPSFNKKYLKNTYVQQQEVPEKQQSDPGQPEEPAPDPEQKEQKDDSDEFWQNFAPQIYMEFSHERAPPENSINLYDCPPIDFQYRYVLKSFKSTFKI